MGLWIVTVETVTDDGTVREYDVVVLGQSERGAKLSASKHLGKPKGITARSIGAMQINVYGNKVVYVAETPLLYTGKEATHAD